MASKDICLRPAAGTEDSERNHINSDTDSDTNLELYLNQILDRLDQKLDKLNQKFDKFEKHFDQKFDELNKNIDTKRTEREERVNTKIKNISTESDCVSERLANRATQFQPQGADARRATRPTEELHDPHARAWNLYKNLRRREVAQVGHQQETPRMSSRRPPP